MALFMATTENLEIIIQLFHLGVQIKCRDYPMPQPFFREREWFVRNHATNIQKEKKASPFINLKHTHEDLNNPLQATQPNMFCSGF